MNGPIAKSVRLGHQISIGPGRTGFYNTNFNFFLLPLFSLSAAQSSLEPLELLVSSVLSNILWSVRLEITEVEIKIDINNIFSTKEFNFCHVSHSLTSS